MPTNPFSIPTAVPGLYQNQGIQSRDNLNELDPEEALAAQNLNRKQQIANLLMQRGLQPIQGVQAGRFYVPPNWAQGLAQLASAGLGAGLTNKFGEDQAAIGQQAGQQRAQAVQDYIRKTSPQEVTTELEGPGAPVPRFTPPELQQMAPSMDDATLGDMANAQNEGPRPQSPPTMQAPTEDATRQALIQVMTARDPSIRKFGELQFQAQQAEKEHAAQRAQQTAENAKSLEVRREGIAANTQNTIATLQSNILMKQMMIDSALQRGGSFEQVEELKKSLAEDKNELERWKAQLASDTAITVAGMKGSAGDKKQEAQEAKVEAGRNTVSSLVATLGDAYDQLDTAGGITNPDKSTMANIQAGIASSGPGQMAGKLLGTQNQSLRNQIVQQRPLLLNAIKEATGMSAKQMDSNAELKMYLSAATDPNIDIKANRAALAKLEELYGLGGKTAAAGQAAPAAPAKVTSDADYEALAPGTTYLAPDGTTRTKKK